MRSLDLRRFGHTCRAIRSGGRNHRSTSGTTYLAGLRQTVRDRFANGTLLALLHDRSWTGRGVSDICVVCSKPIFAAESSQEVIGVRRAHVHLVCYRAWLLESIAVTHQMHVNTSHPND